MKRTWLAGLLAVALVAAGCTSGGDDSDDSTATTAPTGEDAAPATTEPTPTTEAEPEPLPVLFEPVSVDDFIDAGERIDINTIAPGAGPTEWHIGGALSNPVDRVIEPVIVTIDLDDTANPTTTVLPADGATRASVAGLMQTSAGHSIAVGRLRDEGLRRAVAWSNESGDWELIELPDTDIWSWARAVSDDGRLIIGGSVIDGIDHPRAWLNTDGTWAAVELPTDPATEEAAFLGGATMIDGQILAVGSLRDATTGARAAVWTGTGPTLDLQVGIDSLPANTHLADVTVVDGTIVVVGNVTVDDARRHLSATAVDPAGPWTASRHDISTSTRQNSGGNGFEDVVAENGVLYAGMTGDFLQSVAVSDDLGRNWTSLPNISDLIGNGLPSDAFAVRDGVVVIGGNDLLLRYDEQWTTVRSTGLPRLGQSQDSVELVANGDELLLAVTLSDLDNRGLETSSVGMYRSADGQTWARAPMFANEEQFGSRFVETADGLQFLSHGSTTFEDPLRIWSPAGSGWQARQFAFPTGAFRSFAYDTAGNETGSVVVGTTLFEQLDGSLQVGPLAHYIAADGSLSTATVNSLAPTDRSSWIQCSTTTDDGFVAIVEWSNPQAYDVISSVDGITWNTLGPGGGLDGYDVGDCEGRNGEILVAAKDGNDKPLLFTSPDGLSWTSESLPAPSSASPFRFVQFEEVTLLLGWAVSDDGRTTEGSIWYDSGNGWQRIGDSGTYLTGLGPDDYADSTSAGSIVAMDGMVYVSGSDQGRVGLWQADLEQFAAALAEG